MTSKLPCATYVYVVLGFGACRVFWTRIAAEEYRARYATKCEIQREVVRAGWR